MYMMKYVDVIVRSMISNFILNLYEDAFFCIGAIAHYFFFLKKHPHIICLSLFY